MSLQKIGKYIEEFTKKNKNNAPYPVYSVTNSNGFCTDYFSKDVSGQNKTTYKIVPNGYFAYNPSRINVGSIDWQNSEDNVIVSPLYVVFKCSDSLDQDYLKYFLKSSVGVRLINEKTSGSVRNSLKFKELSEFELNIVDVEEQRRIVNKLKLIESAIENEKKQINLYDELVKARFVEMFGDPINNPKGWDVVTIGNVVTDIRYGTSKPAVEGGKYPYLRMNNLTDDGRIDLNDLKYIDIPNDEIEKCVVRKGDVLFNRTNSIELVGKTAVYDLPKDMVIAGYIIRVRLNERLLPEVLSQYMNLKPLKDILRSMAKGSVNQANINAQELQSIKIYVPDIKLQKQFVDIKEQVDKSKFVAKKRLKLYEELLEKKTYDFYIR